MGLAVYSKQALTLRLYKIKQVFVKRCIIAVEKKPNITSPSSQTLPPLTDERIHLTDSASLCPSPDLPAAHQGHGVATGSRRVKLGDQRAQREGSPDPTGRPADGFLAEINPGGCYCDGFLDVNHRPGPEGRGVGKQLNLVLP